MPVFTNFSKYHNLNMWCTSKRKIRIKIPYTLPVLRRLKIYSFRIGRGAKDEHVNNAGTAEDQYVYKDDCTTAQLAPQEHALSPDCIITSRRHAIIILLLSVRPMEHTRLWDQNFQPKFVIRMQSAITISLG